MTYSPRHLLRTSTQLLPFADQFAISAANFLSNIVLLNLLGISAFGVLAIFMALVQLCNSLVITATIQPMSVLFPRYSHSSRQFFLVVFLLLLLWTGGILLVLGPILGLYTYITGQQLDIWKYAFAFFAFLFASNTQEFFRRRAFIDNHLAIALSTDIIRYWTPLFLFTYVWYSKISIDVTSCIDIALCSVAASLLPFALGNRQGQAVDKRPNATAPYSEIFREVSGLGASLASSTVITVLTDNAVIYFGAALIGPAGAGALRAIQSAAGVLNPLIMALENIVTPSVARSAQDRDELTIRQELRRWLILTAPPIGGISIISTIFAEPYLHLLYPGLASQYALGFQFLISCFFLMYIRYFMTLYFRVKNGGSRIFISSVVHGAAVVLASYPLIAAFGVVGSALCLAIGQFAAVLYLGANLFDRNRALASATDTSTRCL